MKLRYVILIVLLLALVGGGIYGWTEYQSLRADYDAYRALIQPGARVAGIDVGWLTPAQAREKVTAEVAAPYHGEITVRYREHSYDLSPVDDLGFEIPVDDMVERVVEASHQYDYWDGFQAWLKGEIARLDLEVPFEMSFDQSAAEAHVRQIAAENDLKPVEPMVDVKALTFYPGRPGHHLEVADSIRLINELVPHPDQREVELPGTVDVPDQSRARLESMLGTLGPVMARAPVAPSYYTATLPISTTGGIEGTPTMTYTGPVTWTFPQFAGYTGPLTETTGFFFDPGEPGYTFNIARATTQAEQWVKAGKTDPIVFEATEVPPPPLTLDLLLPPLEKRLAKFPGTSMLLVKNLDTNEVIYDLNMDYVLSGMSIVKVGIMVEVYRAGNGVVDEETHQLLLSMLGSSSSNPAANFLLMSVGGGSGTRGAANVTKTMQALGYKNFRICAPYVIPDASIDRPGMAGSGLVWALWQEKSVPGYDRCIRATPREMTNLVESIYRCTENKGTLRKAYPQILTPDVCQDMIDIMAANDLRNLLGAGIPPEVTLAHKHGYSGYDVPWGDTRAEVGIVYSPGATYLVSFYIWQDTPWIDFGINQPLYRDVSNLLYNYFNPTAPYWPRPPWAPEPVAPAQSDA